MRAILTYHSVDDSDSVISISEREFADHVRFLSSGRVRVMPLSELLESPDTADAVALTFDDGFANFATAAWPLLRDAGLPATVYVVSEHVGGTNLWGGRPEPGIPRLSLMDWDALARLAEEGLELGGHGGSHCSLEGLAAAALRAEVEAATQRIREETGQEAWSFAYPYGDHDDAAASAVGQHYGAACTTRLATLSGRPDPLRLPRLDAFYLRRPGALDRYGTPAFARFVRRRAMLRQIRGHAVRMLSLGRES